MTSRLSQSWRARTVHLGYLGPNFFYVESTRRKDPDAKCSQLRAQVPPGITRAVVTSRRGVVTSVTSTLPRPTHPLHSHPLPAAGPLSCRRLRLPFVKPEAFPAGRLPPPRRQILTFQVIAKVTERQSEPRGSSAGRLLGNKKGRTSRRPAGSPLFSASSPKMLLGAANAAARFNNCVRQPAPPPQESQMTGGEWGGNQVGALHCSLPASAIEKIAQGPTTPRLNAKESSRNLPSFLFTWQHFFQETRRMNQTRGKYCELTCFSK